MRPYLPLACLVVILVAGLLPAEALRIPLRKMKPDRALRAEVPQPLTPVTGYFAMDMLVGNPQQVLSVEVDTSSWDLLLYGPACPAAICAGPKYRPGSSATSAIAICPDDTKTYQCDFCVTSIDPAGCAINDTDADASSVTGVVAIDQLSLYGLQPAYVYFGQLTSYVDLNGNPLIKAGGVSGRIGLGYGKYGLFGLQSPIYTVQWLNNLPLGFSLCMAGAVPFIDMGEILATSGIYEWTPGASPFYYGFLISDIAVQYSSPSSLLIDKTPVEIDSLLSGLVFPASLINITMEQFTSVCPSGPLGICSAPFIWDGPVALTATDIAAYPTLVFTNDDISNPISFAPADYLVPIGDGTYSGLVFYGSHFKFGLSFFAKYRIGIDLLFPGGYGRVGFASTDSCVDNSLTTSDSATVQNAAASVAATIGASVSSTTNVDLTTTLSTASSATTSSQASLSASTTQAIILSTLSASATGNGPAQASTTASVSTSTTAYVAATTLATSTSRVTASTSAVTTSTVAAVTTSAALSLSASASLLSTSVGVSTTAAFDSSTRAVTLSNYLSATNVASLSRASTTIAATTASDTTTYSASVTTVSASTASTSASASTSAVEAATTSAVSTRAATTSTAASSIAVVSSTAASLSSTLSDASLSVTTSTAAGPTTSRASSTGVSSTTSTVTTNTINHKHQPPLRTGEIIAIVVLGLIIVIAILALIAVCYHRNKTEGYIPLPPAGVGEKGYIGMTD